MTDTDKRAIEEMARHIPARIFAYDVSENSANLDEKHREIVALHLYRAGYRKQSEGEWIPHRFDKNGRPISWYCSNCRGIGDHSSYCSHCGAKMKGGE